MNRIPKTGVAMAIACLMTMATAHAQAQGPGPRGDSGGRGRGLASSGGMMLPVRNLSLTDAQLQQVEQITAANRDEMSQAQKRVREAEMAQRATIQMVPLNESLVRSSTQALAAAQTDLAVQEARVYNDVWQVLTLDQQTKVLTRQSVPSLGL